MNQHANRPDNPHAGRIAYVQSMWQVSLNSFFIQIQNCNKIGIQHENNMTIMEKESITTYAPAKVRIFDFIVITHVQPS